MSLFDLLVPHLVVDLMLTAAVLAGVVLHRRLVRRHAAILAHVRDRVSRRTGEAPVASVWLTPPVLATGMPVLLAPLALGLPGTDAFARTLPPGQAWWLSLADRTTSVVAIGILLGFLAGTLRGRWSRTLHAWWPATLWVSVRPAAPLEVGRVLATLDDAGRGALEVEGVDGARRRVDLTDEEREVVGVLAREGTELCPDAVNHVFDLDGLTPERLDAWLANARAAARILERLQHGRSAPAPT
jgi:hypothetical protein